jgi:hypothetical protein
MLTVVNYLELSGATAAGPDGSTMFPVPVVHFTSNIGPSISTPIFTGGHLVAAGYSGIHIFKSDDSWNFTETSFQPGMFEASPVCHNGKVLIASRDGYLYCYGDENATVADADSIDVVPQHPDIVSNNPPPAKVEKHMAVVAEREVHAAKQSAPVKVEPDTVFRRRYVVQKRELHASKTFGAKPDAGVVQVPSVANGSYLLIAGAFKSKENAVNYTAVWKKRGYPAEMILQPSGLYYVSILRGATEEQLLEHRATMKLGKDPLPWIWTPQE